LSILWHHNSTSMTNIIQSNEDEVKITTFCVMIPDEEIDLAVNDPDIHLSTDPKELKIIEDISWCSWVAAMKSRGVIPKFIVFEVEGEEYELPPNGSVMSCKKRKRLNK